MIKKTPQTIKPFHVNNYKKKNTIKFGKVQLTPPHTHTHTHTTIEYLKARVYVFYVEKIKYSKIVSKF